LLSEIEQLATRVLIIDKGQKLVEGNATELFDPAQTIVELQTMDNAFALEQLKASPWSENLQAQRSSAILIKLNRIEIPALHTALAAMQIQLLSLQPRHSLEDFFLQITSGNQHVDTYTN
jgi:ABC-type multidrug transport system ATPase subunit